MKGDVWKEEKLSNRSRHADKPPVHVSSPYQDNRYADAHRQLHTPSRKPRMLMSLNSVSSRQTSEPSQPDWEGQLSTPMPMVLRDYELCTSRTTGTTVEATAGDEAEAHSLPNVFVRPSISSTRTTSMSTRAANSTLVPTASQHIESFMATSNGASMVDHPTAQTSPIDGVSKLLRSNPKDPFIIASLNTHTCASTLSSASASTSATTFSRASDYNIHTRASNKCISNLHNRPFSPAFIDTARPSKPNRILQHTSSSSAMPTSITAAPSTSNRMLGGPDSPARQAAKTSSLAAQCHLTPANTQNIPLEYTHNVSLPTVSKVINIAATDDPSAIATANHTPLCMAGTVSQDLSSRQMILKRLLAKPAPIFVNPPVAHAGYIIETEDLHDSSRNVLPKSDLRGGREETATSTRTEDGYVRKSRDEDTTFGRQDDLIAISSSGGKYETQVNSLTPVTTNDHQTTIQKSTFDNVWEENVLVTRPAGAGRTSTCNTVIEMVPGPGFSSVNSGLGNVKGGCAEKLWSPTKDENTEKAPKKNVLRRKRSVGGRWHNTRNFSNTDLPGASHPEDFKHLTASAVGRHLGDSDEVHMVPVAAAVVSTGIFGSGSLSLPTPAYAPVMGFVHRHPRTHNEPVSFNFNGPRPAVAMCDDVVQPVIDRQSIKKGGKECNRRGQRNVSPGNDGRTLSTTVGKLPSLSDEAQRRVCHHRSHSKQGKVQECVREAVIPWRGGGDGLGEDETLDSSTALQFSKDRDTGYVLAVGRSGDSSDDCDYSDSLDSKSVVHGASMIRKPSFTKRRMGVMSDHGHRHAPEDKLELASWENGKRKEMARAARRSDKRSPKPLNVLEKEGLTKDAGKPPGKPNNRKSWWGLMRKFSVSITRDRRIKPSPSMPALSDWSRSTATTTLGQPRTSSECLDQFPGARMARSSSASSMSYVPPVPQCPATVALERRIVNPSVLEKAYSQEEERNHLKPQVEELLAPLVPPSPNTPREGDWVRSQSPDIELVSLPLPPRKSSKQVSPAERQIHSFAPLGEKDINCSGSPIIPTFSTKEVINVFSSSSRPKTLSYTEADTSVTPSVPTTSGSSTRDSMAPPIPTSNPSSIPTPRHLKSSRKSSVKRLPSVGVDELPLHYRHRSKSTGPESNYNRTSQSPSENASFPFDLAFIRSQMALSSSASSAVIHRPGTANTFGSAGVQRPGTGESTSSVASDMTIMARETGRFVSPALARQLSSPDDAANVDGILGAILDAL